MLDGMCESIIAYLALRSSPSLAERVGSGSFLQSESSVFPRLGLSCAPGHTEGQTEACLSHLACRIFAQRKPLFPSGLGKLDFSKLVLLTSL